MKTIWTYIVAVGEIVTLNMPGGAVLLPTVEPEAGGARFWAEVDPIAPVEERRFVIFGTGQSIPAIESRYVGTSWDGLFAWHLFELVGIRGGS